MDTWCTEVNLSRAKLQRPSAKCKSVLSADELHSVCEANQGAAGPCSAGAQSHKQMANCREREERNEERRGMSMSQAHSLCWMKLPQWISSNKKLSILTVCLALTKLSEKINKLIGNCQHLEIVVIVQCIFVVLG